jgi:hypothetical protein
VLAYCARFELQPRSGLKMLTKRIKIHPPDFADVPLVERASLPPSLSVPPVERCLACEADIEGVPESGVWLRRTSRRADFERVAAQNCERRRKRLPRSGISANLNANRMIAVPNLAAASGLSSAI